MWIIEMKNKWQGVVATNLYTISAFMRLRQEDYHEFEVNESQDSQGYTARPYLRHKKKCV